MHRTTTFRSLITLLPLFFLLVSQQIFAQDDEFLMPNEAFQLSVTPDGNEHILVNWKIADGYYLYRNKIKLASESEGVNLGEIELPKGKTKQDEFFGKVEIFREAVSIRVPFIHSSGAGDAFTLKTVSQGCADAGLCYPPQTERIDVKLPTTANPLAGESLAALSGLGSSLGLDEEPEIPTPDQAFQLDVEVLSGEELRLLWRILPGTYLYQDKIALNLTAGDGVVLGTVQMPEADIKENAIKPDGSIGDLPVYHDQIDLKVPLKRSSTDATDITLQVKYQGCAEVGICYPPVTRELELNLPALATASTGALETEPQDAAEITAIDSTDNVVSEQDQIAATLANSNMGLIILSFFGFGLLLALTPCVFPMIPILSGIIAGHGSDISPRKAFTLSMVYVQAMALTYTAVGVLAGLTGANLQAAFQNPWILITFALIFVLLALSMFGFYELQLPSRWQSKLTEASNRQKGGSLIGVAIMGLLSALIVGPCVAPPLFGALIYISQTGDAVMGGLALYALSMGMGVPLLIIGTSAGKLLPRAGAWMEAIKAVFGVGLLAVAIIMLERILPAAVAMILWGALMISSAVYMGALQQLPAESSGWKRLWKSLGVVLLIYGALMLVGAAAGGKDTVQPLRGLGFGGGEGAGQAQHLNFKRIKSVDDLNREVAAASSAGNPVMLDFYADWCVSCKEMERYTFSDPAVISALNGVVLLQADVTANDEIDQALMQGHFGIPGPPSIMFYGRDGEERKNYRVVGFMEADRFAPHVQKAIQ